MSADSLLQKFCMALIITISVCCCPTASSLAQQNNEVAIANELVINSRPLHRRVAERYAENASGDDVLFTESSHSASRFYIPVNAAIPEGQIVDAREINAVCSNFHKHIRKLRRGNAIKRSSNHSAQHINIVYNFRCSPNAIMTINAIPNDSSFRELWAATQSNNVDLDLPEAWDRVTGRTDSHAAVIAIIDTGIDYRHQDLAGNVWRNLAELTGRTGVDDDQDGVIDNIYGYNSINNSGDPLDDHNHGTHVAGTIGAASNNSLGVTGVTWNMQLMGVKFLSSTGSGSLMNAVKSINFVTQKKLSGVNIIASNNSWGGGGFYSALYDAIASANSAGILFIAAAGNDGRNIDESPSYPASYDLPNVISVGSLSADGQKSYFSNYGLERVDIFAPGSSILSTIPGNFYGYMSGTSMATPQVSGLIALLHSYAPSMSLAQLRDTLFVNGKTVPGAVKNCKYGTMPSAVAMLDEADRLGLGGILPTPSPPRPTPTKTPTPTPTASPTPTRTPTPTPTVGPGYWKISGSVKVGDQKLALAKVRVEINGQYLVAYTDSNGNFSFHNVLGPSPYVLSIISAGQTFSNLSGTLSSDLILDFKGNVKYYSLMAKVTDKLGQPLSGVTVSDPVLGVRLSNEQGLVEFSVPYGTKYEFSVFRDNDEFLNPQLSGQVFGDVTRSFVALPN